MAYSSLQWFGYLKCAQYPSSVYEVNEGEFPLIVYQRT